MSRSGEISRCRSASARSYAELLRDERHRLLAARQRPGDERRLVAAVGEPGGEIGDVERRAADVESRDHAQDAVGSAASGKERLDRAPQSLLEPDTRLVSRAALATWRGRPTSPGCLRAAVGAYTFSTGLPRIEPIVSASVFTLAGAPAATLKISPLAPVASPARIVASTTLPT